IALSCPSGFFPSVSRDPIRGSAPRGARATETPWSCQDGPLLTAGQIPGAPPVGSSDGVPISPGPRPGPQPPPVSAPYTNRAGFVEAGDRADQHTAKTE